MSFPFDVQLTGGEEYRTSTTKEHRLGQRGETEDGRVYRYCKNNAEAVTKPYWACMDFHDYDATSKNPTYDCLESDAEAAQVIGDWTITAVDANTDHVEDFFAEGSMAVTVGSIIQLYSVKKNTSAAVSTTITFTLAAPLPIDVAEDSQITVYPSPYSAIRSGSFANALGEERVVVCVAPVEVAASSYFWGQTWGPCYGVPSEAFSGFRTGYSGELVFSHEGSIKLPMTGLTDQNKNQHAGHRLFHYTEDLTGALLLYMLEIRP